MNNTCDTCKHFTLNDCYKDRGACDLMGDANDLGYNSTTNTELPFPRNKAMGWDYEGYLAGVYVGPKFGCIHWSEL